MIDETRKSNKFIQSKSFNSTNNTFCSCKMDLRRHRRRRSIGYFHFVAIFVLIAAAAAAAVCRLLPPRALCTPISPHLRSSRVAFFLFQFQLLYVRCALLFRLLPPSMTMWMSRTSITYRRTPKSRLRCELLFYENTANAPRECAGVCCTKRWSQNDNKEKFILWLLYSRNVIIARRFIQAEMHFVHCQFLICSWRSIEYISGSTLLRCHPVNDTWRRCKAAKFPLIVAALTLRDEQPSHMLTFLFAYGDFQPTETSHGKRKIDRFEAKNLNDFEWTRWIYTHSLHSIVAPSSRGPR